MKIDRSFGGLWPFALPLVAWGFVVLHHLVEFNLVLVILALASLVAASLSAVHHSEVIAVKLGEPYGTVLLAVSVTAIEMALIVILMSAGGPQAATVARDAVFAAIMLIMNGIVGGCLLIGGLKHHEQSFGLHGVTASLAALAAIAVLTLILPNYTVTVPGPFYSASQLGFIAVASALLYGVFLFIQTLRHRDYFLPAVAVTDAEVHVDAPSMQMTMVSIVALLISLAAVVMLAEGVAPTVEIAVEHAGAPRALVGIFVALLVLIPEGVAALRAALSNRLQTSLNLALGSALASIGLTIPAIAIVSLITGWSLSLGLDAKSTVLFVLTLFVSTLALGTGRTTVLQGAVHLLILGAYLFTTAVP